MIILPHLPKLMAEPTNNDLCKKIFNTHINIYIYLTRHIKFANGNAAN